MGTDAVLVAIWGMEGRSHVIITDNFFTLVKLFTTLLQHGFYDTGIVKKGFKGYPSSLASPTSRNFSSEDAQESIDCCTCLDG